MAGPSELARLRKICRAFPDFSEVIAWGEPTFRVRNKIFAMYAAAGNHHTSGRPSIWCMSDAVNQQLMVQMRPDRFFVPPYVGPSGWTGMYLDKRVRWSEVADLLREAYEMRAAKKPAAGKGRKRA